MNFSDNSTTTSEGRNGCYKCCGIVTTLINRHSADRGQLMIQGLTSKGLVARGDVSVPLKDVPALIVQLQHHLAEYASQQPASPAVK